MQKWRSPLLEIVSYLEDCHAMILNEQKMEFTPEFKIDDQPAFGDGKP
jgi:hypothetical protein